MNRYRVIQAKIDFNQKIDNLNPPLISTSLQPGIAPLLAARKNASASVLQTLKLSSPPLRHRFFFTLFCTSFFLVLYGISVFASLLLELEKESL